MMSIKENYGHMKKTENSWAFRITWTNWKKYISHNETGAGFNEMFSDESSNSN